jgi:hypothetical protein
MALLCFDFTAERLLGRAVREGQAVVAADEARAALDLQRADLVRILPREDGGCHTIEPTANGAAFAGARSAAVHTYVNFNAGAAL